MSSTTSRLAVSVWVSLVLLLSLHNTHVHAAATPGVWLDKSAHDHPAHEKSAFYSLLQAMLSRLQEVKEKRTRADGGFFSRHDAMSDYLQSAYANELASDLYGPGKRK